MTNILDSFSREIHQYYGEEEEEEEFPPKVMQALEFADRKYAGINLYVLPLIGFLDRCRITNQEILCAAALSDLLGNTNTTEEEIHHLFGEDVVELVRIASRNGKTKREQWKQAKECTRFQGKLLLLAIQWTKVHQYRREVIRELQCPGFYQWSDAYCRLLYTPDRESVVSAECKKLMLEVGIAEPATEEELEAYYEWIE